MKKLTVKAQILVTINANEDTNVSDVMSTLTCSVDSDAGADVEDAQVSDYEVVDCR